MKSFQTLLPLALALLATSASAQETSSTLMIPGPMEQSVTAISGTRTDESTAMTSTTDSSSSSSSTSSGSQASLASSVIVNAGNPGGDTPASATSTSTSPSAGSPGNVSQTGVQAAQNTGVVGRGVVGVEKVVLVGLGVGAALMV